MLEWKRGGDFIRFEGVLSKEKGVGGSAEWRGGRVAIFGEEEKKRKKGKVRRKKERKDFEWMEVM